MPSYKYTVRTLDDGTKAARVRVGGQLTQIYGRTERELRANVGEAKAKAERGEYVGTHDGAVTFRDYATEWAATNTAVVEYATAQLVNNSLEKHWYPIIGDIALSKLRPRHLQAAIADISKTLAASTIKEQTAQHLKQVLNAAVDDKIIATSPAKNLKLPKVPRREVQIPTVEEVTAITDAIDPRYRALVVVAAGLGLRQGEAFGLSWDRVRLRDVKIDRQLKRVKNGSELGTLKTERSDRTIPMPQYVAHELARHRELFKNDDPDGLLFVAPNGGRLRKDQFGRRFWKPAAEAAGVPDMTMHPLRHFYASALIRHDHGPAIVAARLGNSPQMVHATYSHLWIDDDDRTRQAIDDVFTQTSVERPALSND